MLRDVTVAISAILFAAAPSTPTTPVMTALGESRSGWRRLKSADEVHTSLHIDELSAMADNWDGYGSLHIDPRTARNAKNALIELLACVGAPDITPNPNGTLSFEWASEFGEAHMEIGLNRFSSYVKFAGGTSIPVEGGASNIPNALGALIAHAISPRTGVAPVTRLELAAEHDRNST